MAKMRMVVIDIEGVTESMLGIVLRDVLGAREDVSIESALDPVDREWLDSVPLPTFPTEPPAPKPAKVKHPAKAKPAPKPLKAERPEAPADENTCRAQVYALLKSGPKTSKQLIDTLPKYSAASIYLALKELRNAMLVKSDMVDGEQRNVRLAV